MDSDPMGVDRAEICISNRHPGGAVVAEIWSTLFNRKG